LGEDAGKVLARVLSDQPLLKNLILADVGIEEENVSAIIKALMHTAPNLEILDLSYTEIGPGTVRSLARLLKTKPMLKVLRLEGNDLRTRGVESVVAALGDSIEEVCGAFCHRRVTYIYLKFFVV
jgi:Ran GTPase-activating protein (RanGAP) involved in mRNA processing and transport